MAWFARSIANSLKMDEEDEYGGKETVIAESGPDEPSPRGVKEDISELTKTFRSQLWGVASFLAPPPAADRAEGDGDLISGMRNDFVEMGGRFRTGISKLSGVSKLTNFLQLDSKEPGDAIGVSEEVVGFARDLALHPETWLDFPIPEEDHNFDDFEMTEAQYEHALAVESLTTSLAALRIELCPAYMTENCFWRIYFVLAHPKFTKHHALLLSTPKVLEARALLSHELHKRNKPTLVGPQSSSDTADAAANVEPLSLPTNPSPEPETVKTISVQVMHSTHPSELETDKHTIESKEIQVIDKPVIEAPAGHNNPLTASSPRVFDVQLDDDADDWLKDEDNAATVSSTGPTKHLVVEDEDITFSDLEEDDDVPVSYNK